ncbi:MAG: HindVP family restriction endonuclease [Muribaculaceae bacterium]|nr:HindVP family restriction endonuclease [Muribaculaceae bacterium]
MTSQAPGLFAQPLGRSSRDYTKEKSWGKNIFNSSFPVSLSAYMYSKDINPVYLKVEGNEIIHDEISVRSLFQINPLSENVYFNYEAGLSAFDKYYVGSREKIDLVVIDKKNDQNLIGLEIKLTALPDSTTKKLKEDRYGCELVMRPPTICFLACTICHSFQGKEGRQALKDLLGDLPQINHWEEIESVLPYYEEIQGAINRVSEFIQDRQVPLVVQPIWKTYGGKSILSDDCLDIFAWSNLAILRLCVLQGAEKNKITRFMRTIIWIYRMLFEYSVYGQFDYKRIVRLHSYNIANDKAFAASGLQTWPVMKSPELEKPRISKWDIKNIILGGGQDLLSPERRFDAVIVNSPDLFE